MDPGILKRVLVTDRRRTGGRDFVQAVLSAAARGSATLIILREKDLDDAALEALARPLVRDARIPVMVAHRPAVALSVRAAGVHLGATSPPIRDARAEVGPKALVSRSVHAVDEGISLANEPVDFFVFGPVRESPKAAGSAPPVGFDALRDLALAVAVPIVGIGGLGFADEAAILETGAAGFAAIRAFIA